MSIKTITTILIFLIVVSLIIETTLVNFPFIFFLGAVLLVLTNSIRYCLITFAAAIASDSLRVSDFGWTAIFLIFTILLVIIYERYSGSKDFMAASVIIAMFGFIYSHFMGYSVTLTLLFYILVVIGYFTFSILRKNNRISL